MGTRRSDESPSPDPGRESYRPRADRSRAVEDYLKAIRLLQREATPVATSALAEHLERSPASVTNMLKSLAERDLVEHVPYYGVRLSDRGEREALRIIRRHRVIEAYLIEKLGYSWDRVHAEAERLEHAASDDLVERMAATLGNPEMDPHGSPIPTPDGELEDRRYPLLAEVASGTAVVIREVSDADEARLRGLAQLGLFPGTRLQVVGGEPFGGPIVVRAQGRELRVTRALAEIVSVESDSTERPDDEERTRTGGPGRTETGEGTDGDDDQG